MAKADTTAEIYVGDQPAGPGNPLAVTPIAGGAGGLTDAELRATAVHVSEVDGANAAIGTTTDAEATGNGSLIAIFKRIRTRIDVLITTLTDGSVRVGGTVEIANDSGNSLPVSGTVGTTSTDGGHATIGTTTDAAAAGNGSVIALLKKIRDLLGFSVNAGTVDATTLRVITASDGPLNTNLGTTTDAGVSTDANGSVSAKLRGLIILVVNLLSRWPAALGSGGGLKVDGSGTALPVSGSVSLVPITSGGLSIYRNLDLGVTGQVVKASAGQIYGWTEIINLGNANRYIKVYDKATAPTQADTPVQTLVLGAAEKATITKPNGEAFTNGISLRATTGLADNDTGAPTSGDVIVNLDYK